jgi:hypothetical protein
MTNRIADLRESVIARLDSDADIDSHLGTDGGIIPTTLVDEHDDLNPRIAVHVSVNSITRNNLQEEKALAVRVTVEVTKDYVRSNSQQSADELLDDVVDVLTTHADGWGFDDDATVEGYAPSADENRFLAVIETAAERTDAHTTHT